MPSTRAGWAVHGKPPGAAVDYRVLSSSEWPLSSEVYGQWIGAHYPGEPPRENSGANAFPWAILTAPSPGSQPFRAIALMNWSIHVDSTNRRVVETRYCMVESNPGSAIGLKSLHDACLASKFWQDGTAGRGEPIRLELPDPEPQQLNRLARSDFARLAEAAGAVLDRRVVVILPTDNPVDIEDRLTVMDSVAGLLPGGGSWLQAATWWDHQSVAKSPRRPDLTFSTKPAADCYVLGRTPIEQLSADAATYCRQLIQLAQRVGPERVLRGLAGYRGKRPDATEGLLLLLDLDLPNQLVQEVHSDSDRFFRSLQRLVQASREQELEPDQRLVVLNYAASRASPSQLPLLRRVWSEPDYELLARVSRARLWQDGWSAEEIRPLVEVGIALFGEDRVLYNLCRRRPDQLDQRITATLVGLLSVNGPGGAGPLVRDLIAGDPRLAIDLVMHSLADPGRARQWLKIVDSGSSHSASGDRRALNLFSYAFGLRENISANEVPGAVDCLVQSCGLPGLRRLTEALLSERRESITPGFWELLLGHLRSRGDGQPEPEAQAWMDLLRSQPSTGQPDVDAIRDVLLCRWGPGPQDVLSAVWAPDQGLNTFYLAVLHEQLTDLPAPQYVGAVSVWAAALPPDWLDGTPRDKAVLDALWQLAHDVHPETGIPEDVLRSVAIALMRRPGWVKTAAYKRWVQEIRKHKGLLGYVVQGELAELGPDAEIEVVTDLCYRYLEHVEGPAVQLVRMLRSPPLALSADSLILLCEQVILRSLRAQDRIRDRVDDFVSHLLDALDGGPAGRSRADLLRHAAHQAVAAAMLLRLSSGAVQNLPGAELREILDDLVFAAGQVDDVRKAIDQYGRGGRWVQLRERFTPRWGTSDKQRKATQ